jgi:hypothetical protein
VSAEAAAALAPIAMPATVSVLALLGMANDSFVPQTLPFWRPWRDPTDTGV